MEGDSIIGAIETAGGYYALVPIVVGIIRFRSLDTHVKAVFLLLIVSFLIDTAVDLIRSSEFNTNHLMRVFSIAEFSLLSLFFMGITQRRKIKVIMASLIIVFVFIEVLDALINGVIYLDSFSIAVESVVFILYTIVVFLSMLRDTQFSNILSSVNFWILTAILVYFSGSFIVFVFSTYLMNNTPEMFEKLWIVHSVLYFIFNTLVAIGFWKAKARVS